MLEAPRIAVADNNIAALQYYIEMVFGYKVPNQHITPGNATPMEFIMACLRGEEQSIIGLANRNGGKTQNQAIIDVLNSEIYPGCETATVGAIKPQAERGYRYFTQMLYSSPTLMRTVRNSLMKGTQFTNGSLVEILVATLSGVNSPHPNKLKMDEVELMEWQVIQEAVSMPKSKYLKQTNEWITAQTIFTSTRKFSTGPMQRLLDEAEQRAIAIYQWNIWDVIEALPPEGDPMHDEIFETFGDQLPANIHKAEGYYSWRDLLARYRLMDREVWDTQWICIRPGSKGLVYDVQPANDYVGEFKPDPAKEIYIWEDYGYADTHPDVVQFVQVTRESGLPKEIVIFDEMYLTYMDDEEIQDAIDERLKEWDLYVEVGSKPYRYLDGYVGDPHNLTSLHARRNHGFPVIAKPEESALDKIVEGVPIVRNLIKRRIIKWTAKAKNSRWEHAQYHYPRKKDGTFGDKPEKVNDHGPDTTRYGCTHLFPELSINSIEGLPDYGNDNKSTITGGIMTRDI